MSIIARGWIIWRPDPGLVKQERYEVDRLLEAAPKNGYEVEVIDPGEIEIIVNSHGEDGLLLRGEVIDPPDFIIPRMGSATDYYMLAVMRHLEDLGVITINNADSVALAQDKLYHLQVLAAAGSPIPRTMLVRFPISLETIEEQIGLPVVIKTLVGTQGSGVFLAKDREQLNDVLQFVEANNPQAQLVLQQYLEESKGRDVRILAIGGQVIAGMERRAKTGFKSNYSQGGEAVPFTTGPKNNMTVAAIMDQLDMDMAGLDFLYDKEIGFRICEVNSSPGFEGLEATCDVDVADMVFKFLDVKFGISEYMKSKLLGTEYETPEGWKRVEKKGEAEDE